MQFNHFNTVSIFLGICIWSTFRDSGVRGQSMAKCVCVCAHARGGLDTHMSCLTHQPRPPQAIWR